MGTLKLGLPQRSLNANNKYIKEINRKILISKIIYNFKEKLKFWHSRQTNN